MQQFIKRSALRTFGMQSKLLKAAKPYYIIFVILAITPPIYVNKCRHLYGLLYKLYTLLMLAFCLWISYVRVINVMNTIDKLEQDRISSWLGVTRYLMLFLTLFCMQVNVGIHGRQLHSILTTIATLEHDIGIVRQRFGMHWHWRLAVRSGAFAIILTICNVIVNVQLSMEFLEVHHKLIFTLFILIVEFKAVEYCVFVQLVQELLLGLQYNLSELRRELANCVQPALHRALCKTLRTNQYWLAQTWRLVSTIESYFTLPLLFLFLHNGLTIMHVINWAYIRPLDPNYCCFIDRIIDITLLSVNILIPCWISQCCINTYNNFTVILHNLKSIDSDMPLLMQLREFSLQLMHQRIKFTCGGLFDINLKNFSALMLTIMSYSVILIQFKMKLEAERITQRKKEF